VPPTLRLFAAAAAFAAWLVLLFFGYAFGGGVHLLALAGILLALPRRASSTEIRP
jgi:hypothetical protein